MNGDNVQETKNIQININATGLKFKINSFSSQVYCLYVSVHSNDQPSDSQVHLQYQTPHHKHNKCMCYLLFPCILTNWKGHNPCLSCVLSPYVLIND